MCIVKVIYAIVVEKYPYLDLAAIYPHGPCTSQHPPLYPTHLYSYAKLDCGEWLNFFIQISSSGSLFSGIIYMKECNDHIYAVGHHYTC